MLNSLRSRLWLTYALAIGVALSIVGFVLIVYFARNPVQLLQAKVRLQVAADTFVHRAPTAKQLSLEKIKEATKRIDTSFDVRVLVYSNDGELLADSRGGKFPSLNVPIGNNLPKYRQRPTILVAKDESGKDWVYITRLFQEEYILVFATPRPVIGFWVALRSRGNDLLPTFRFAGVIALALGLIFAFWIAHWVLSPIRKMIDATQKVSAGEYSAIPLEGPKEVRSLAEAFNQMSEKVMNSQQSMKDFIANVSHELKTPLTSIKGFAQAILDGTADTPEARKQAASIIFDEANQMHQIVLELLDLARFDAGSVEMEMDDVDCNALLEKTVEKFLPLAREKNIEIETLLSEIPLVRGDDIRLMQAFSNLLDNAIKYSPPGKKIVVSSAQNGSNIEIEFRDWGRGIDADEISRIFERFYQTDKSRTAGTSKGYGLGLAITKEIITSHGGWITAHSQKGKGSTFKVVLPQANATEETKKH